MPERRALLRLVVPSPDGRRLLARPNGLAGWALPAIAVVRPFLGWDDASLARAAAVVGAAVEPIAPLDDAAWAVRAERVGAAGNTWIGAHETERLGSDAALAQAWFGSRHIDAGED